MSGNVALSAAALVTELISALAWPLTVLVLVFLFRGPIRDLLNRDDVDVTVPGGFSIAARNTVVAAEAIQRASTAKGETQLGLAEAETRIESVAQGVEALGRTPHVLWVDDRPSNNRAEVSALTALGIQIDQVVSTDAAIKTIAECGRYDLIISDMGRPPDDRAGYTLLSLLRNNGDTTPFVIYAASRAPEHFNESVRRGAVGCTNRPSELIEMVSSALRREASQTLRKADRAEIGRHGGRTGI